MMKYSSTVGIGLLVLILSLCAGVFFPVFTIVAVIIAAVYFALDPIIFARALANLERLAQSKYLFAVQATLTLLWGGLVNVGILGVFTDNIVGYIFYVAICLFIINRLNRAHDVEQEDR